MTNRINIIAYNLIYSFHMPLFVIISGYFFNPSQNIEKLKASTIKLVETFLLFYIIHQSINWIKFGIPSINYLITPSFTMWYLWVFILWRITAWIISNNKECGKSSILIAFTISLLIGLFPFGNELSVQRFFALSFFFVIGIYWRKNQLRLNKYVLLTSIPILFFSCYVIIKLTGRSFDDLRWIFYYNQPYIFVCDAVLRFMALILGLSISILLWYNIKDNKIIAKIGASSLPIYMLHPFLIKCYSHFADIYYLPQDIVSLLLICLGITCGIYLISRNKHFAFVLNPLSYSLKSIRHSRIII